ncbi:MAG: NAD-dependent dehydratase [Deltaproteobacteria bacterium]|nr:NAD-dependent dehydratase [Deltaproteobacteria bacterium]
MKLPKKTLLILGATGQVGEQLLRLSMDHEGISRVVAPTRRPLRRNAKLENPIIDFENFPKESPWWKADLALCALGTTLKRAGSKEAFSRVDHDYVLRAAESTHSAGTPTFGMVSSLGAAADSRTFYFKVKGETERDLAKLGFPSLTIARPSLLIGEPRSSARPLEALGLFMGRHFGALLPKRYRPVTTTQVARALLQAGLLAEPGIRTLESEDLLSANF